MNFRRVFAACLPFNRRMLLRFLSGLFGVALLAHGAPATVDSPDYRKYAPDRFVDIVNLAIDIVPDFQNETISARATYVFKPIAKPLREWKLDAQDLNVSAVTASVGVSSFHNDDKALRIFFKEEMPVDREQSVTITYTAAPKSGLHFRTPKWGYRASDTHLFTQGEDMESRHWFPTHDFPNEKFASEITCHVPQGMVAFANGKKLSETKGSNGLTAFHWKQEKPHTAYLVCLVAGYFKGVEDTYKNLPLGFYAMPSEAAAVANSFAPTKECMAFFEEEIGVPYPWEKYYQVCVSDFMFGGMENTSLTTLTENTLFTKDTENLHDSEGLVAHELAHQWFGDLVTCKDWSHAWLNEGFATYYAHLFDEKKNGRDSFLYQLYDSARGITRRNGNEDTKGLVHRRYDNPMEIFFNGIYPKGAWVLHMLRADLGPDLYRKVIKTYLERNAFQTVETHHLSSVVEEFSGRSFDQFFDQWLFRPHFPELNVSYAWDENAKLAKLTIRQVQPLTNDILLFNFPLKVRFKNGSEIVDREIRVKEKAEDFYFKLEKAPAIVRLDPEFVLLAKTAFSPPRAMIVAQLKDKSDVIGRLLAIELLKGDSTDENIKRLKDVLNDDPFFGVRQEAVAALRAIHTPAALDALLASTNQPDARVRIRVADAIGSFYHEKAFAAHNEFLKREKNPDILGESVQALALSPDKDAAKRLLEFANGNSFHNRVEDRAISALRARRDSSVIPALIDLLNKRWDDLETSVIANAMDTLAQLGRDDEKQRDVVREFLTGRLNEGRQRIQIAAIRGLGALRDERAIPMLETFATAARENPTRNPAETAINAIRAGRPQGNESQALRTEVMDLKKENRELREDLKTLTRKVDALTKPPAPPEKEKDKAKNTKRSR